MGWWNKTTAEIISPESVNQTALDAGMRAREVATNAHLPESQILTAQASAIGTIVANQYTPLFGK